MKTEESVCDAVVEWARVYRESVGPGPIKLAIINRRWGKQLRSFGGGTIESVLRRDGRFAFSMNGTGGFDVMVRLMSRSEALAQRAVLDAMMAE